MAEYRGSNTENRESDKSYSSGHIPCGFWINNCSGYFTQLSFFDNAVGKLRSTIESLQDFKKCGLLGMRLKESEINELKSEVDNIMEKANYYIKKTIRGIGIEFYKENPELHTMITGTLNLGREAGKEFESCKKNMELLEEYPYLNRDSAINELNPQRSGGPHSSLSTRGCSHS